MANISLCSVRALTDRHVSCEAEFYCIFVYYVIMSAIINNLKYNTRHCSTV